MTELIPIWTFFGEAKRVFKKTVYIDGVEKKIVDREATIVARQKQELIKQAFSK